MMNHHAMLPYMQFLLVDTLNGYLLTTNVTRHKLKLRKSEEEEKWVSFIELVEDLWQKSQNDFILRQKKAKIFFFRTMIEMKPFLKMFTFNLIKLLFFIFWQGNIFEISSYVIYWDFLVLIFLTLPNDTEKLLFFIINKNCWQRCTQLPLHFLQLSSHWIYIYIYFIVTLKKKSHIR